MRLSGAAGLPVSLDEWLTWLERRQSVHVIRPGLERVGRVARRLGLVDTRGRSPLPLTFTVGGTNGKGSSTTLLADTLTGMGEKVGRFQSPHLLHYRERVWLDGRFADDGELCAAFAAIEQARGPTDLTYFEVNLLAGLWVFRAAGCTAQVLEVGLGGRLDAVNVVAADAAMVASIGHDHEDWLGAGLDNIAREKAGIFRSGRPAVIAEPGAPAVLDTVARDLGARPVRAGRDYRFGPNATGDGRWCWQGTRGPDGAQWSVDALPRPALVGAVQVQNAAGVLALLLAAGLSPAAVVPAFRRALVALRLPGRFDVRPAVPGRYPTLVLDVAHNAEAAGALADALASSPQAGGRTALLLAMLADKPAEAVAGVLASVIDGPVLLAGLAGPRGQSAMALHDRTRQAFANHVVEEAPSVAVALARAHSRLAGEPLARLVVCGSFHTLAEALQALSLPLLPEHRESSGAAAANL